MAVANSRFAKSGAPNLIGPNPTTLQIGGFIGVNVPQAQIDRALYTVPALRKCYVAGGVLRLRRASAAAPAAVVRDQIWIGPNAGAIRPWISCSLSITQNAINDTETVAVPSGLVLPSGWVLRIIHEDGSAGGTCDETCSVGVIESDA